MSIDNMDSPACVINAGMITIQSNRLDDLPLWRLLVALHDAEFVAGLTSESAVILRRAIENKLRRLPPLDRAGEGTSCKPH